MYRVLMGSDLLRMMIEDEGGGRGILIKLGRSALGWVGLMA